MLFDNLFKELACGPGIIRALVAGMTAAEARSRPLPESWSTLEVVCHLRDEEREDFRPRLDLILHRPYELLPSIDPQSWVADRRYNERDLAEMLDGFVTERARSLDWLQGLAAADWEAEYTTPFGSIKAGDMLAAWAAHDNLHTRQLVELRRNRLVNLAAPYEVRYAGEW